MVLSSCHVASCSIAPPSACILCRWAGGVNSGTMTAQPARRPWRPGAHRTRHRRPPIAGFRTRMEPRIEHIRHTLAHLLAAAVLKLFPDAKRTIGPAIETGFYYDFEFSKPISDEDLPRIEAEMKKLLPTWTGFTHKEVSADEARAFFKGNQYKLERS